MAERRTIQQAAAGDHRALASLDDELDTLVAKRDWAAVNAILDPLAVEAAGGNTAALSALLTMVDNHRLAHGPVRTVLLDPDQIEDAVQDTLTTVARKIDSFEGRSRFTTWLHPVAANAAKMLIRREQRHTDADGSDALPELDPSLRRLSSIVTERGLLETVIGGLPDDYREVLELRELHHLSYQDIADHLGVELGTVKSRLNRGKEMARESLARYR